MTQTSSIRTAFGANAVAVRTNDPGQALTVAANPQSGDDKAKGEDQSKDGSEDKGDGQKSGGDKKKAMTPEEKMQTRFPQPVKAGRLVGMPIIDRNYATICYVQQVVRTPDDKVQLIVPYGKRFGWLHDGGLFGSGRRLVAVPIEVVGILAYQILALDWDRGAFDKAPTWVAGQTQPIPPDQTIKIALGRR